jgi:copper resistance protein C
MVVGRTLGIALSLLLLTGAPTAFAHAFLERAEPPVGSSVPTAPHVLLLHFTEGVEPRFSTIAVTDDKDTVIPCGAIQAASDGRALTVSLPALKPGTYAVTWHVTSVDTHKTQGSFKFTVEH